MDLSTAKSKSWVKDIETIFLVGSGRSGTTWLQSLLSSHPRIYTGVETHFFSAISPFIKEIKNKREINVGLHAYLNESQGRELLDNLFWKVITNLPSPNERPQYFLEKTPRHVLFFEEILFIFPNTKIIHIIRDGRMVVNSCFKAAETWAGGWATNNLYKETLKWKMAINKGREAVNLLKDPKQYFEVKYEDLRENTENSLLGIFDWLNLDFNINLLNRIINENSIDFMRSKRAYFSSITVPFHNQQDEEIKKIYPDEFIQKGNYKNKEYGLSKYQKLRVDYLAGDLLIDLGYTDVRTKFSFLERFLLSRTFNKIIDYIRKFLDIHRFRNK